MVAAGDFCVIYQLKFDKYMGFWVGEGDWSFVDCMRPKHTRETKCILERENK